MTDVVLILTTAPSSAAGETIALALVEAHLAACVTLLPSVISIYRWQSVVEKAAECQVVIKTTRVRISAVAERLRALHSYEVPEFLVLPVEDGGADYLAWLRAAAGADGTSQP